MDWALIGNIPIQRAQKGNALPSHNGTMPTYFYQPGDPITQLAGDDFFQDVGELYQTEASQDKTPAEPCGRIHGCGAASGLQVGYLSGTRSVVRLGNYNKASIEYSFAPYGGLASTRLHYPD